MRWGLVSAESLEVIGGALVVEGTGAGRSGVGLWGVQCKRESPVTGMVLGEFGGGGCGAVAEERADRGRSGGSGAGPRG